MFYSTPCVECTVIKELASSRDLCAIINYEGENAFMKVLGSKTHGPSNPTEVSVHSTLVHRNILPIKDLKTWNTSIVPNGLALILEAANVCLIDWVSGERITFSDRLNYAFQCVCAVYQLHKNGYLHLDIKPDNFVVINDVVKLTDFGFSRKSVDEKLRVRINHEPIRHPYITSVYRAPEAWVKENEVTYTDKMDIFSLGLTLLAVLTDRQIYPRNIDVFNDKQVENFVVNTIKNPLYLPGMIEGFFSGIHSSKSEGLKDLVVRMVSYNPDDRPSIEEVMGNPAWKVFTKPSSAFIIGSKALTLTNKVKPEDMQQDILYVINFYVNFLGDLPASCMFLSVDLYYRSISMINGNNSSIIFNQRRYLAAVCTWLGVLCNYTENSKYYDLIVKTFGVSNARILDGVISEVIIYLQGVLQPDSYFEMAKNAEDLRYFINHYLKQPEKYITMNFSTTGVKESDRSKFISIKELNY